jgi:hypothetical protein
MYALRRCMFGFHSWATVSFQELIFRTELISDTRSVRTVDDHSFLLLHGIVGSTLMYSGLLNRPLTVSVQACYSTCLFYLEEPAGRQLFTSSCCTKYVTKIGLWLWPRVVNKASEARIRVSGHVLKCQGPLRSLSWKSSLFVFQNYVPCFIQAARNLLAFKIYDITGFNFANIAQMVVS